MKRLLLILVLSLTCITPLCAQDKVQGEIVLREGGSLNSNEEPTIDPTPETKPIRRSISLPSVYAYIYNKVVTLDFMETCPDVTVTVTNEDTGEVVYWESFSNPAEVNIDLTSNGSGNHRIDIVTDDSSWEGIFSL